MNIRDLKYLVALSEHLNFHKAAQECFVSQPTLSTQIKKLEETLGVMLIERNPGRLLITSTGKKIVIKAKQILLEVEQLKAIAVDNMDICSGKIKLGFIPTISPYLLPKISTPLHDTFPDLNIQLYEHQTERLLKELSDGKLDCIIMALPIEENIEQYEIVDLFQESYYLCTHKSHELAKNKKIKKSDLKKYKISLLEKGHCLRGHVKDVCHIVGAEVDESYTATSLETLRHMVCVNQLVTLIPEMALDKKKELAYIPMQDSDFKRNIVLMHRKNSYQTTLFIEIAKLIKELN